MTPDVSILMATIRPGLAGRALGSIAAACAGISYEVIVVADFDEPLPALRPLCPHLLWIQSERKGVVDAINVACQHASGSYWFTFNDESVLEPGAIAALHREASPLEILTPRHVPPFRFEYYGRPFPPFPFADRELLRLLGGLLDPAYGAFYADPDLGMRADKMGIPVRVVDAAVIHHANNHDANHWQAVDAYLNADRATFRSRWDHLGTFEDP